MRVVEVIPSGDDWAFWFSVPQEEVPQYAVDEMRRNLHRGTLWEGYPWATVAYSTPYKVTLKGKGKRGVRYVSMHVVDNLGRTPWDIAKAHLKAALRLTGTALGGKRRRYTREDWEAMRRGAYGPQYARPGNYSDMAYVDIRGAYYTLYSLYWATEYYPRRFLGRYSVFPLWSPELRENKKARNALWGIARSTRISLYTPKGEHHITAPHNLSYPQMVLGTTDALHTIAHVAVRDMGAVYVMTDGYILPLKYAEVLLDFLAEMGLQGRLEEVGDAWVGGVGAYRIGAKRSKRTLWHPAPVDNIRHHVADWLLPRHKWLVQVVNYALGGRFQDYLWRPVGEEEALVEASMEADLEGAYEVA